MFKKILVGYDGSKAALAALQHAAIMAREYGADLHALWVREPLPRHSDLPGEFEGEQEAAAEYFEARKREVEEVAREQGVSIRCDNASGHPAQAIVQRVDQEKCDLIVAGHSDHAELWGRLLGDTADRIGDHARCSVLIVKPAAAPST